MSENQRIEWKSSWRDEYLQWVCGFANAEGGVLEIGKDDRGQVVGIENARKLMEDLPNKIRDVLGIIVEVNLQQHGDSEWITIEVEPYPFPVSLRGHYYFRSGSTNQELKGAALDRFLLRKQGKTWDGVPVPFVNVDQLEEAVFTHFKKLAAKSERISLEDLELKRGELLEKLHLIENGYLNRAAVLLFHPEPQRFVTGASVKVGFFLSDSDLRFHDEIRGNLFQQVDKTLELLLTKYLIAGISYSGAYRVETLPYPQTALREALINAICHKDYASGNPIQISVYKHKILFFNQGVMPETLTIEKLRVKHSSVAYNPAIANAFFRAGLIEAWGSGCVRMIEDCRNLGIPEPDYRYDMGGFWVEFNSKVGDDVGDSVGDDVGDGVGDGASARLSETSKKILELIKRNPAISIAEIADQIGVTKRSVERSIQKLQQKKMLTRIGNAKTGHWLVI